MTTRAKHQGTGLAVVAAGVVAIGVAACGCATLSRAGGAPASAPEAWTGWQALADGRRADAERSFDAALAAAPRDPVALFGRASIAYERGASEVAAQGYATALAAMAGDGVRGLAPLAIVAAGRLAALYDDLGEASRARLSTTLRPVELARSWSLPSLARFELAQFADQIARKSLDADGLAAAASAGGCAQEVFDVGTLGPLPNLDLDAPVPPRLAERARARDGRRVLVSGCRLDLAAPADGRGGARLLRAEIDVPGGVYDIVLDHPGEGRLTVDGGQRVAHGSATGYGPRISIARVALARGRHDIEVRIASRGGRAGITLAALPVDGDEAVARRWQLGTDPRAVALAAYCDAYAAARVDDAERASAAVARLRAQPRFALGLTLAGAIARDDATRPANLARDAARRLLRSATAMDAGLARAWYALAMVEIDDDRSREGIDAARAAVRAAPAWWMPELLLARALTARGLDFDGQRAIEAAAKKSGLGTLANTGDAPCPVLEALRRNADQRRALAREAALSALLDRCGGRVESRVDRLRARGDRAGAIALLRAALRVDPDRDDLAGDLALLLAADGRGEEAIATMTALSAQEPSDPWRRVRLADVQIAAGKRDAARANVAAGMDLRPDLAEIRRAARALGVASPLDDYRVEGRDVIRAFEAAGRSYAAPAVTVLDRSVMRVFATGAMMVLTHQIVRVDSKEAIDRWGEISVPAGADILALRTHKRDGSTREPEEIAGKDTVSAPDLALGDYVEWELLETRAPSAAFAPGFLTDRFYFQSFDSPLVRSELMLVTPPGAVMEVDRRAGAPAAETRVEPDGTQRTTYAARDVPQLYAERAAVSPVEYVPSVRVSSGVAWRAWARYVAEELHVATRSSADIRAQAKQIQASTRGDRSALATALVGWVTENVEAGSDFGEPASFTLAHGRGSRLALCLALARELGLPARPVLARSRLVADATASAPVQEVDDFADALLEIDVGTPGKPVPLWADLRLRHAALGYLPPGLDGARALSLPEGAFLPVRSSASRDHRIVDMTIRLDEHGGGVAVATEDLAGWPALEWAARVDQLGADRTRLRQDFEQRWLGVHFPGAHLRELEVELPTERSGRRGTARVRYSFASSRLAVPIERNPAGGREMRIEPTFFRSQPGRRFAAEPQRTTSLVLGFDVPVRFTATVELPGAARIEDTGGKDVLISRRDGYRFVEERRVRSGADGTPSVLVLRRESALPIMRVTPGEYAAVAADLRRVDGVEQEEIRIRFTPGGRGNGR